METIICGMRKLHPNGWAAQYRFYNMHLMYVYLLFLENVSEKNFSFDHSHFTNKRTRAEMYTRSRRALTGRVLDRCARGAASTTRGTDNFSSKITFHFHSRQINFSPSSLKNTSICITLVRRLFQYFLRRTHSAVSPVISGQNLHGCE